MDRIICLVGESGSGKSTIAELLGKEGYNYIESYTTRKPRYKGERGHMFVSNEYYFNSTVDDEFENNIIAYTFFDNCHYWATREQYQNKGTSIYVIDPAGIKDLKQNVKDAEIVVIYLKSDDDTRARRMYARKHDLKTLETKRKSKYYGNILDFDEDILLRLDNDKEAFMVIQTNYVVNTNRIIKDVFKDVKSIIEG